MKSNVAEGNGKRKGLGLPWRALTLASILCALMFSLCGCTRGYGGETEAEANRRHKRILRTNMQALRSDIDTALMLDRPSHLTDRRLP